MMSIIDHTTADFNADVLTRGYAAAQRDGTVYYVRKTGQTDAHVIVSDRDGLYEFTCFSRNSAERTARNLVD